MGYVKLRTAANPDSPDFMLYEGESQPLVDAAYLVHSSLRGHEQLQLLLITYTI